MTDELACRDVIELFTALLEGALDPVTADSVREHLAICEGCDRYLEQLKVTISEVGRIKPDDDALLPAESVERLTTAFRATFPKH